MHLVSARSRIAPSSIDKLSELWAIGKAAYGAESLSWETFKVWWRSYRPGVKSVVLEDRIVGAIAIWPLSERCANRLASGRIKNRTRSDESLQRDRNRGFVSHWNVETVGTQSG